MTDRCEPPEELRGVDGWHWVQHESVETPTIATWEMSEWWPETGGAWRIGSHLYMPQPAHKQGWRYLAPVTPPAEVEALRATVAQLREALEQIADRDFNCSPHQHGMAAQEHARAALANAKGAGE